jgi:hypothetical protein
MKLFKRLPLALAAASFFAATSASAGVIYETIENWGENWAPDDELGNKHYWNNQTALDAARLVRKGNAYSLAVWFDRTTPLWPSHPAIRVGELPHTEGRAAGRQGPFLAVPRRRGERSTFPGLPVCSWVPSTPAPTWTALPTSWPPERRDL